MDLRKEDEIFYSVEQLRQKVISELNKQCGDDQLKWRTVYENILSLFKSTDDVYDDWLDGYRH